MEDSEWTALMIALRDEDPLGQASGNPEAGAENTQNHGVALLHQLNAAARADAQRHEAVHVVVRSFDVVHDRATLRRQLVQSQYLRGPVRDNGGGRAGHAWFTY